MPIINPEFKVIPEGPLEWERFFRQVEIEADIVEAESVQDNAVTEDSIANNAVTTSKIEDQSVTLPKLQDLTADRIVGRLTTGGSAQELTAAQVRDLLFTQQSNITNAETAHALNATFSDTEVEAALDALGSKINEILTALDNLNLTS